MEGGDETGWEIAAQAEIGIAENIHEVGVCDIACKVADKDAVLDGVVDGAKLLSNGSLGDGRVSPVDFNGVVRVWEEDWLEGRGSVGTKLVPDALGDLWAGHDKEGVARVVWVAGGVGCDGGAGDVHLDGVPAEETADLDKVVLVHPRL
jgi:hypothetical protein